MNESIEFKIENKKRRFVVAVPFLIFISLVTLFTYLANLDVLTRLSIFIMQLTVAFIVNLFYIMNTPWDKPSIYIIRNDGLWFCSFCKKGEELRKVEYDSITKVRFKNSNFTKVLILWTSATTSPKLFTAPAFEKCETEWQRLFEEIRKRVPEDTKIIIK